MRGVSQLYKDYLFGFETLVLVTLGILSMHEQLVTLKRLEIASYDPFNMIHKVKTE